MIIQGNFISRLVVVHRQESENHWYISVHDMGKLSGLISSTYGFTVEAATALSHPPTGAQSAPHTSNYGYYSRSQNAPLYQQPNAPFSSHERRELPLPVIIPQRRPQNKSRGWARAYAPALMGSGIDEATFLDFLDRFNEESKVC